MKIVANHRQGLKKIEEEKQAPKGRPKSLVTAAKQAVEDCDKICELVDNLIEE